MGRRVKTIDIIFENTEFVVLPERYFLRFEITGIKRSIERRFINAIIEMNIVDRIFFELDKEIVNSTEEFECDIFTDEDVTDNRYIFKRIGMFKDITQLCLTFDDGSKDVFYAPWADGDEYHNFNQKSFINERRNLVVDIKKPYHKNRRRKRSMSQNK